MSLIGFDDLFVDADASKASVRLAVAGGDDPTVIEALSVAHACGWVLPTLIGAETSIHEIADSLKIDLHGFRIIQAEQADVANVAVAEVKGQRAQVLMKGQITTSSLMHAVLDREHGLRTDRVLCQVVLMEIPRDGRKFLMADTGITIRPTPEQKLDILQTAVEVATYLGSDRPRVAMMAATETVKSSMPETLDAAYMETRSRAGEIPCCVVQGPLSFDLAYSADAADKKRVPGEVVGAADVMIFPDLLSANLTVKAIMYTADCRFGGVIQGASAPIVFMSRADQAATRLRSLALALRVLKGTAAHET